MGCTGPKSLISCRNGKSFFDIVVDQVKELNDKYGTDVPLVLMHSFNTDDIMRPHVEAVKDVKVITFNQNKFPRIYTDTLEPVPENAESPISMWNPPGHADVYHCLRESGLLDKFLAEGKTIMMISNIDNLGSVVDLKVLNKAITENRSYMAETVLKTLDDWKGGMPIMYKGHMKLLETAIVPKEHFNDYTDMNFLNYFHANNLWVNLVTLKQDLSDGTLKLDTMRNYKKYNNREIVQLEAACGSAIQSFKDSCAVRVPRNRFLPVKSCNELLLVRANVYIMEGSHFVRNPARKIADLPSIQLSQIYQHVEDFEKRFPEAPDMVDLVKLHVDGDVFFGKNIKLVGNVDIQIPAGQTLTIPDGKVLKDCTIRSAADL
ncbi:UTP--glucose-1-phosphate uridylyltransferase family protein [Trichomonas vaginalis G3]|uniref:UTP--glucose-1-phosphate uridylyltransferase n=1 Tax=Trichomonas vaginalis (strain ATCC PRA-98 / G3) TaxID=412133 RepID=A2DKT6_TRIV3|nr:UTP:glucose-1-phosphate uridylyltransferase protein [Trichomonas vaginalis G3]EAY19069.1 UTP--glucose-1-phosphate uridylyltransferase family protein [Trichomonas vaginalis G3]KAI5521126.1 UTP:glucose-1-phosphate uridylyltransferase protein [Trichomonas vaginalis G3]|eukprot:XP_001580055.1 UTP--glucose-1-phosphate uridylyltransferase family protein [Trichomonas vaginalis G3]